MQVVEDTEKYLKNFLQPRFTEIQFVRLLLTLLNKNGITEIDEDELSKKLYYYYIRPEYKELFEEIGLVQSLSPLDCDGRIDINEGMYQQKYFSGSIWWDSMRTSPLHLQYNQDIDLSYYKKYLSEDGLSKMHQMVNELSNFFKIEEKSDCCIRICAMNPNKNYTLCHGDKYFSTYSWELVTDGDIKKIEKPYENGNKNNLYVDSPTDVNIGVKLENNEITRVSIQNASYVVMQGLKDLSIQRLKIYTMITDYNVLEKISMVGQNRYQKEDSEILFQDKTSVKKIVLK